MSVTFPCYCRVLDAFKPEKKDQMPLKKGEFVRVLRADETDDNYFGEVFGKSGFFPNYYVEVVTEEDVPKKDRELFKKLDKTKEAVAAKEKEKEEKLLQKSPVPRLSRNNVDAVRNNDVSPRRSQAEPDTSPRMSLGSSPTPPSKSPSGLKKPSLPGGKESRISRRKSGEISLDEMQIEKNSVVLPSTPLMSPQNRKLSSQPRRMSRVNPRDVKRLYEGPTFGVPLAHQMYIGYEEFVIPPILHNTTTFLLSHLEVEGLFRVSGSQDEISEWKASFNDGKPVDFVGRKASPHSVAGLLKAWLRELPEPLLTYGMFEQWMRIATKTIVKDPSRALLKSKQLVNELPPINTAVLRELFRFLQKVVGLSAKNLMTAENVGVVIGPNILAKENQDALASAHIMPAAVTLTAFLVKHADEVFENEAL